MQRAHIPCASNALFLNAVVSTTMARYLLEGALGDGEFKEWMRRELIVPSTMNPLPRLLASESDSVTSGERVEEVLIVVC